MRQIAKLATLQLLRGYKWAVSPMFPPACRYVPTCSEYAMEAVERYGALRGGLMALGRLLRCHPFAQGGYDPVVKQRVGCANPRFSQRTRETGHPATNFPQGLKPSLIAGDSSQRLKRYATQNPNPSNVNGATLTRAI